MQNLFITIDINKPLENKKESLLFYILKNKSYGIEISKKVNDRTDKLMEVKNVFNNEKEAKDFIEYIVENNNDISQVNYLIEDYKRNEEIYA